MSYSKADSVYSAINGDYIDKEDYIIDGFELFKGAKKMKKLIMLMLVGTMVGTLLAGCGNSSEAEVQASETVEETVETVEVAEVVEEVESTPSVEEVAEEVTEEATEESETDIAVETDLPVAGIGSDKIPFEGQSDDIFGVIYSLEEVPFMVYNYSTGGAQEATKELESSWGDNGCGSYTYKLSGKWTVNGLNIEEDGAGYAIGCYDAKTGLDLENDTAFLDDDLSTSTVDTVSFIYSITFDEPKEVVWGITAWNGDTSLFPARGHHVSELELPMMFCK